jgi:Mlc titration factor MtfA (ptsG expression regulator)
MDNINDLLKDIDKLIVIYSNKINVNEDFDLTAFQVKIEELCLNIKNMDQEQAKKYLPDLQHVVSITSKWQQILSSRQKDIGYKIEAINKSKSAIDVYNNINLGVVTNDN